MTERREKTEKHGVVFALWDGNKIQLEKRNKPNGKFFGYILVPGGGVEQGETLEKALLREVREEYKVKALIYKKLGNYPSIEDDGILNVRHLYLVTKWLGILSNPEDLNDHIEATLEEAFEICKHPLSQVFLKRIQKELSR